MNLSKEDKEKWILENCVDRDGDIDLRELKFPDHVVLLSRLEAKLIYNNSQKAEEITNGCQEAEYIYNGYQEAEEINNNNQILANTKELELEELLAIAREKLGTEVTLKR